MPHENEDNLLRSVALQTAESIRIARQRAERQAEATLQEQANLLNLTHDSIFVHEMSGVVRYWNRAAEELYGWTAEQTLGKNVHQLLNTVFPVPLEQIEREVMHAGRWEGELVLTKKDGSQVVVTSRWSLQRDERGAPVAILQTNNDITERKRTEQARKEVEALWRAAFESNPTMYFIVDARGAIVSVNAHGAEQLGYGVSELVGQPGLNVFYGPDRQAVQSHVVACFAQPGRMLRWEARKIRKDGTMLWVRETANAVVLKNRPVLLVACEDITEQKRAEALLAGEKRILEMVAKGDSLAQILDSLCRLVEEQASGVLASILLLDGNRLRHGGAPSLPKAYTDAIDGAEIGPSAGSCGTAAYHGEQIIVSDIATDPLWAQYRDLALPHSLRACWSTPIFSSEGKVIATFAMYYREPRSPSPRDQEIIEQITHLAGVAIERRLTQEKLRRSEAYLAEAQRLTDTGSWAFSPATRKYLYWSEEMFRIWAFDPRQGPPDPELVSQRFHPEDLKRMHEETEKALSGSRKVDVVNDFRIVLPDGTLKYINTMTHPVFDDTGNVVEYVGTSVDVTERKRAEEELLAAETRFRTYVDHATGALFVHDEQGKIVDVNRQACESLGYTREELIGIAPRDFDPGADEAFMQSAKERLDAGEIFAFEASHRRKDGTLFPVEVRVRPFSHGGHRFALSLAQDITDRRRAEEERERLRQFETDLAHINRVTTMGELTASLAHEVNQPIAAAITNANTCVRWLAAENPRIDEAREAATRTVKSANRAAEIVGRIRSLFKKSAPQHELLDLNEVIIEMTALLRSEAIRSGVSIRTELSPEIPQVAADRVQLQQVLMNLMLNGIEAMAGVDRDRELTLTSQRAGSEEIRVSVGDTGVGLPPEGEQIFKAFFTTKPEGTGMGLAISRSIVESHGGRLWATSNAGQGAMFHFTLPLKREEAPPNTK